ncbi:MAG: aspartate aminotransferase family protein [Alphaproteobacteria bacterium]|nr:aspartate aminotransferase family protein [Alphaproteobacteria bacterium]
MSPILHRGRNAPPIAVRGEGNYLVDAEGKRYFDGSGGAAVSCLGHSHPRVREALHRQIDTLDYAHTSFFSNEPMEKLGALLVASAPSPMEKVYFVSGGSEAMEAALKLARQYFVEIGQKQRTRFLARQQSYHGNTLGALGVGGNALRRAMFAPLLAETHLVGPCYAYRNRHDGESEEAYGARLAGELEAKLAELGAETVIAFVAETVGGATQGCTAPVPGYLARVDAICKRHGILLILDEVMCGMGRCGTLFAYETENIRPDIVAIAKGLGGGAQPIGAIVIAPGIAKAIEAGSGAFMHGHTYLGHPMACAAALAVQETIREENLLDAVRRRGAELEQALTERLGNHAHVGDIRGRGLFWAVELVADRRTKAPFDPKRQLHAKIKREAFARGLLCYSMGGTVDGRNGDHVMLAPPYVSTPEEIAFAARTLGDAIDAALADG